MSENIAMKLRALRGQLVILDVDLAALYGVAQERLVELFKRDHPEVPVEFAFSIKPDELQSLEHCIASLAFTEYGVIIAANALSSPHAMEMSIHVVRAFVKLREVLLPDRSLVRKDEASGKSDRVLH